MSEELIFPIFDRPELPFICAGCSQDILVDIYAFLRHLRVTMQDCYGSEEFFGDNLLNEAIDRISNFAGFHSMTPTQIEEHESSDHRYLSDPHIPPAKEKRIREELDFLWADFFSQSTSGTPEEKKDGIKAFVGLKDRQFPWFAGQETAVTTNMAEELLFPAEETIAKIFFGRALRALLSPALANFCYPSNFGINTELYSEERKLAVKSAQNQLTDNINTLPAELRLKLSFATCFPEGRQNMSRIDLTRWWHSGRLWQVEQSGKVFLAMDIDLKDILNPRDLFLPKNLFSPEREEHQRLANDISQKAEQIYRLITDAERTVITVVVPVNMDDETLKTINDNYKYVGRFGEIGRDYDYINPRFEVGNFSFPIEINNAIAQAAAVFAQAKNVLRIVSGEGGLTTDERLLADSLDSLGENSIAIIHQREKAGPLALVRQIICFSYLLGLQFNDHRVDLFYDDAQALIAYLHYYKLAPMDFSASIGAITILVDPLFEKSPSSLYKDAMYRYLNTSIDDVVILMSRGSGHRKILNQLAPPSKNQYLQRLHQEAKAIPTIEMRDDFLPIYLDWLSKRLAKTKKT